MKQNDKILSYENKIKKYKKMKAIGILLLVFGIACLLIKAYFLISDFVNNKNESFIFLQFIRLVFRIYTSSFLLRLGLLMSIIYSNLIFKNQLKINKIKSDNIEII